MKKIICTGLLALVTTCFAFSQDITPAVALNNKKPAMETKSPVVAPGAATTLPLTEVDKKVLNNFSRSYRNATDVRWFAVEKAGFVGYYNLGEKKGRCFYDKHGNFIYNILTYLEQSLPFDIRDLVKRTYYFDYTIDLVDEIHSEGETVYVVHISDSKTMKTLCVNNGEITVLKEYNKSK